jgi:hypothetical protein
VIVKGNGRVTHPVQVPLSANAGLTYRDQILLRNLREYDWAIRLRPGDPNLPANPWDFIVASRWQKTSVSREEFTRRLKECLGWLRSREEIVVPPDIGEMIFQQAVEDRQMRAAYEEFNEQLQGDRFRATRRFVLQELKYLEKWSALLSQPRSIAVPQGMSEWESLWIRNLRDLTDTIVNQLRSAKESLQFMAEFLRMGRTKVETYLLEGARLKFEDAIKGRKPRQSIHVLLVAYAHASELIRYTKSSVGKSDPVESMKNRLARAKRPSTIKTSMHSLLILQYIKIDVAAALKDGSS